VTDEKPLREAYRELQATGSDACPTDEDLAALALGELEPARRDALADHVVGCRRCAESVGILLETHREASDRKAKDSRRRRWIPLAAAAAAIAVIGLLLARSPASSPSAERGRAERVPGLVPADGAELADPPARFAWPPSERAEAYRLKIYRDSGDAAWAGAATAAPFLELPPDARARLSAGGAYYWVIEVESSSGTSRLGPYSFRIAPRR
jgi:hypothetical protein